MKKKNFKRLPLIAVLGLLMLLIGCQKDESYKIETESAEVEVPIAAENISLNDIPKIGSFLKARAGRKIFVSGDAAREDDSQPIVDTENIIQVRDSLGRLNYTFYFTYPDTPEHIFYNLIVPVDANGQENEPYVIRYVSNPESYQEFADNEYSMHFFNGSMDYYMFEDFFSGMDDLYGHRGDCVEHDQYGDPIPCQQVPVSSGGTSGGGGTTSSGTYTTSTSGTSSGSSGTGGYSITITVYHTIPTGQTYVFGPGSVCQHQGECIVTIIITVSDQKKEIELAETVPNDCPECIVPVEEEAPVATSAKTLEKKIFVLGYNLGVTFTDAQKAWLTDNEGFITALDQFMLVNNRTSLAKAKAAELFYLEYALANRTGTIVNNHVYPEEIRQCCPGDCCPPEGFADRDSELMWQMGPGIVRSAMDFPYNLFISSAELVSSDAWLGSRVRMIMGDLKIDVPSDIDNATLGRIFQVRKRDLSVTIEYRTGVIRNLVSLGIDLLDVLALTSPSKGGGAFLAVKGGGKVTLGALKDYLTALSKGNWQTVSESMSDAAKSYQEFISGRKWDESFVLNTVKFDGLKDGVLSDAKSGMLNFVNPMTGRFYDWFLNSDTGAKSLINQARRQVNAANELPIEWHFEHESVRKAVETLFSDLGINITLKHTPR